MTLLLSVRETAAELGIGRDAAYSLIHEGRLRVVRLSAHKWLVPRVELDRFIERELDPVPDVLAGEGTCD